MADIKIDDTVDITDVVCPVICLCRPPKVHGML